MLDADRLACVRGDRQLFTDLAFSVGSGELLHVKGVNGSGKTTLLRMLCGLTAPADGAIRWQGEDIHELDEDFRRDVVYLGHLNGIKAELTAIENLRVAAAVNGWTPPEAALWDALAKMGLGGFEDLPTKVLSQGQKRRVALARLLLCQSPLWVLDEPFVALDVAAVAHLQSVLDAHVGQGGIVVLTTHQEFALSAGTRRELLLGR